MATYGDTLNQTFPGISATGDGELHRTFHTPSKNSKPTAFNFEQQFLFGKQRESGLSDRWSPVDR